MALFRPKHAEDVHIFEGLRLRPPSVRARQEIVVDVERVIHRLANLLLPPRGVVLLLLIEFKVASELAKRILRGDHEVFLQ